MLDHQFLLGLTRCISCPVILHDSLIIGPLICDLYFSIYFLRGQFNYYLLTLLLLFLKKTVFRLVFSEISDTKFQKFHSIQPFQIREKCPYRSSFSLNVAIFLSNDTMKVWAAVGHNLLKRIKQNTVNVVYDDFIMILLRMIKVGDQS